MRPWREDLTGRKFTRLTVIKFDGVRGRSRFWECRCECGVTSYCSSDNLKRGAVKSCGCLVKDSVVEKCQTHGESHTNKTKEYRAWQHIKTRCLNSKSKNYTAYGGSGVTICSEWAESYERFLYDMGRAPSPKHSIDRIDNNKGYSPDNCRWATSLEQNLNRKVTRMVMYNGEMTPLRMLSKDQKAYKKLYRRIHVSKWDVKTAMNTP